MKTRAEFVHAAKGARFHTQGFSLQAAANVERIDRLGSEPLARFGFTVTKKIGNAVVRNRIRRRLREAVRIAGAAKAMAGTNYVLVGRHAALTLEFERLIADLLSGLASLDKPDGNKRRSEKPADV